MPYCSLTLLEAYGLALMLRSSHIFLFIFYDWDTYASDYPLISLQSSQISYVKKTHEHNLFVIETAIRVILSSNSICYIHLSSPSSIKALPQMRVSTSVVS